MFTTFDKALVAFVMSLLYFANSVFGVTLGFTEAQIAAFLAALTPFVVYFWPNKKA
jgi:hypothetical protein